MQKNEISKDNKNNIPSQDSKQNFDDSSQVVQNDLDDDIPF